MLAGAVVAVRSENLLRAAGALGTGSVALATLLFLLDAPYAGGFELSVGAGLISVLFVIAISVTESMGGSAVDPEHAVWVGLALVGLIFAGALGIAALLPRGKEEE